jgi:hypothetical protein
MTKLFMHEKPYPVGYEAPSIAGYYMEKPTLAMVPFVPLAEESFRQETPQTLVLRARVEITRAPHWPVLEDASGNRWSLEKEDLYTQEGVLLKDQARVLSVSLVYTGFCAIPREEGALLPFEGASDLLPFEPGSVLFQHRFAPPASSVSFEASDETTLHLFPLGGCLRHATHPLKTTPLYFFVEKGASMPLFPSFSTPSVRLLFARDILDLKANPHSPRLVWPREMEEDRYESPEAALLQGALCFSGRDPLTTEYQSLHVNSVAGDGSLVDVVVRRV